MTQLAQEIARRGTFFLVNSIDPTRTVTVRNRFVADMRRRFKLLVDDIYEAVVELDVFGLEEPTVTVNASGLSSRQFAFPSDAKKVEEFVKWLDGKAAEYITSSGTRGMRTIGDLASGSFSEARASWMTTYLDSAYQQGIRRGRSELRKAGVEGIEGVIGTGAMNAAFNGPIHADRVGLIYTRSYSSLKGITAEMSSTVSDILGMGLAEGKGPREIARLLDKTITGKGGSMAITDTLGRRMPSRRRAEILARTEVIRAHHSANIGEYKAAGLMGIQIQAEHLTAGFGVCEICKPLNGKRYDIDEAEYMIPVHPQCRCVALPYIPDDAPGLQNEPEAVKITKKTKTVSPEVKEERAKKAWEKAYENMLNLQGAGDYAAYNAGKKAERKARYKYMNVASEEVYGEFRQRTLNELARQKLTPGQKKAVKNGTDWVPLDVLDELVLSGHSIQFNQKTKAQFRAHFAPATREVRVAKNEKYDVVGHEMSHAVDHLWSENRTMGGKWKNLSNKMVTQKEGENFTKWFDKNHNHSTGTYKNGDGSFFQDNWMDDYEGRIYPGYGNGVEWWAMNAQRYTNYRWRLKSGYDAEVVRLEKNAKGDSGYAKIQKEKLNNLVEEGPKSWAERTSKWSQSRKRYPELSKFIEKKFGGRTLGKY